MQRSTGPLTALCLAAAVVFVIAFSAAGQRESLYDGLVRIISHPWGVVTLLDLYAGLLLIIIWAFRVEENKLVAGAWMIAFLFLGNFATVLYVGQRAWRAQNVEKLLVGRAGIRNAD